MSSPPIPAADVDDFEIDFGEEPDEPTPAPTPTPPAKANAKPKSQARSEPDPVMGDDAVADFLSTIQLDDEE